MRTSLILLWLASFLFLSENVIAQEFEWIRQFGTAGFETANAVAVDGNSVYTAGHTTGTFPGETKVGTFDAFLRKYDTDGKELWTRQFGLVAPTNRPIPQGIAVDATGVYVAGYVFDPFALPQFFGFVRKYDPDGNEVWTRLLSAINHHNQIWAISADASGVYVAGDTSDTSSVGIAAFVTKYDAAGNELWTRLINSTNTDTAVAVCVDGNGVYVAGRAAAPLPGQTHVSGFDPFVRKYDLNGNEVWTRQFGTTAHFESAEAVSVQGSSVYVVGRTSESLSGQTRSGGVDAFVRKYDIDGNENWTQQFNITSSFSQSVGASADATGVYLAGHTSIQLPGQTNAGGDDAFVRKYDIDGDEAWTRQFGSAFTDRATSVANEVGKIYVAGITLGVLPDQMTTTSASAFVVKLFQVPIADAGPAQIAIVGEVVQLDGSNSADPDGDPISFDWRFLSEPAGSAAELSEPTTVSPTFAPNVAGDYVVQLVVSDGTNDSDPDQVTITAQIPADATQDVIDQVGDLVAADVLPAGRSTVLIKILEAAIRQLDLGNSTPAAHQLQAFNLVVMALIDTGAVSLADGQPLIDAANRIINALSE